MFYTIPVTFNPCNALMPWILTFDLSGQLHGFSSARKMSSALLKHGNKYRLYNKGAAEWVLKRCTHVLDGQGQVAPMSSEVSDELSNTVTEMAKRGLRCICLTYTDYEVTDPNR